MESRAAKVQLLLPAWQAEAFIQPTLDSLSAQTHPDFQVIVSVDRCDDDTCGVCRRHALRDRRFRVVRQESRRGYVGNCNFLLEHADADYVCFAFHDDILAPGYIERLAAVLDARPEVVLSYSDVALTHADGKREHWTYAALEGVTDRAARGNRVLARQGMWWVPNRGLFRLAPARRIGGMKIHGAGEFSVDWPWLFRMSLLGQFARVAETLCFKFYKPGSLSQNWAHSKTQYFEVACACMRELWNSELTGEEKLRLALPLANWLHKNRPELRPGAVPLPPA